MIELRGKLPAGFDPSEIDSRLLRGGTGITLLGIASVDPRSELVAKADEVLRAVRDVLFANPDAASVDVSDVTGLVGIPEKEVAEAFYRLSFLDVFHKSGTLYGADAWKTINVTEQAFAGYFSYETVGQLLKSILSEGQAGGSSEGAGPAPTKHDDVDSVTSGFRRDDVAPHHAFVLGQPVPLEETRHVEFKELSGKSPADSIKNTADEYAVAYLNREGGKIYWGVRNSDRAAVGVKLDYAQRDAVRRVVSEKLSQIRPPVPISAFSCEFHPVRDDAGHFTPDLYVCELEVPKGSDRELYATGGGEVFVKTDGGKRKLDVQQIIAEATRRRATAEHRVTPSDEADEPYPPIPLDERSLSSYIGGSPRVKRLDRRIAEAAEVRVERLGYADAFLERVLWQARHVGVQTLAELNEAVRDFGEMAVRLSHYFTHENSLIAGHCIELVFDVMVAHRGGLEDVVVYYEGMPHSSAGRAWAEEVWHACQQLKMYDR